MNTKNIPLNDLLILVNGKDCHDCVNFLLNTAIEKNRGIHILYLTDATLPTSAKREIISNYQHQNENGEKIKDINFFFLPKNDLVIEVKNFPVVLYKLEKKKFELIEYSSIWDAMSNSSIHLFE